MTVVNRLDAFRMSSESSGQVATKKKEGQQDKWLQWQQPQSEIVSGK